MRRLIFVTLTFIVCCGDSERAAPPAADSGGSGAIQAPAGAAGETQPASTPGEARSESRPATQTRPETPMTAIDAAQGQPPAGAPPASWATYGHDAFNSNATTSETVLGRDNVGRLKERWRVRVSAGATSTPVVYDGLVYFGAWDGYVFAADAETGEVRWQRRVTDYLVRSTPLVTPDRVYFGAGNNLVALNRRDGAMIFSTELDSHPDAMIDSSPKLAGDIVILGMSSIESSVEKPKRSFIGAIYGVDAVSGELVWRIATSGDGPGMCRGGPGVAVWSSAAVDQELGLAYIGTGQAYEQPPSTCGDSLIAFRYARELSGERIAWIAQFTGGDVYAVSPPEAAEGPDGDVGASPNLFEAGGRPLVGVGDKPGSYRVFDRRTGALVWRRDGLGIGAFNQAGGVRATAAVYEGTIYVASNILNEISLLAAAVTGSLLPGEGAKLHALDAATGETRWMQNVPATIDGGIVVANGVLYHGATMLGLFARDPKTGEQLWMASLPYNIGAAVSVVNGRIYLSAGYDVVTITTLGSNIDGGQLISFGLDAPAMPKSWDATVADELEPFDQAKCERRVAVAEDWPSGASPSASCASCLCACDATAAGNCDTCWSQQTCAVQNCAFSAPGEDMHACMSLFCVTKLLPPYRFERSVAVAPCAIQCESQCGF